VRYDGRGTGHSQRDVSDVSLEALLGDLDAIVGAAAPARFALLGLIMRRVGARFARLPILPG